jgi:hypothetical protein
MRKVFYRPRKISLMARGGMLIARTSWILTELTGTAPERLSSDS